uniref:G-protein coupled receptors family 1 profile domain-containing protein n=1 Tax=Trichuris muris TaxID=70415 RepID=A0A5S6QGF9_TRIMR
MTLAIVWESTRIAVMYDSLEMLTPFQCMVKSPYSTLYIVSDTTVAESMLFLSLDLLISLRFPFGGKKLMNQFQIGMIWFYFLTLTADLVYCWYRSVVENQNTPKLISIKCINSEILPEDFYLVHYVSNAVVTLVAAFLCLMSMIIYHTQKSQNDAVRAVQLKRQGLVLKRLATLFLYTLIVQTTPLLVVTSLYAAGEDSPHLVIVWLAQIILYPSYPLLCVTREYKILLRQRSVKVNPHPSPLRNLIT